MTTTDMKTKHTPGPWRITFGTHCCFRLEGSSNKFVCNIDGVDTAASEDNANARLIAAAPELLEALEKAISYLETNRPKGKIRDIFSQLNEHENGVLKPARAAIAKATN